MWLNDEGNFIVRTFKGVTVTRSINFAGVKSSKSLKISAVVKREGKGAIQLWLADNAQVDMYDIATSFCRLLFDTHKANDALVFATILSTDLHTLQKRGYNGDYEFPSFFDPSNTMVLVVGRILKQRMAGEYYTKAITKEADKPASVLPPPTPSGPVLPAPPPAPKQKPASVRDPATGATRLSVTPKTDSFVRGGSREKSNPSIVNHPAIDAARSSVTPKTDSSVRGGSRGRSKPGLVGHPALKFSPWDPFGITGPGEPVTSSGMLTVGGVIHTTLGIA